MTVNGFGLYRVARDWRKNKLIYLQTFGCYFVLYKRDLRMTFQLGDNVLDISAYFNLLPAVQRLST